MEGKNWEERGWLHQEQGVEETLHLLLPNKGKRNNEVNHEEANHNKTEKEVSKTCGHLQVKEGKSDTQIGVTASILAK